MITGYVRFYEILLISKVYFSFREKFLSLLTINVNDMRSFLKEKSVV